LTNLRYIVVPAALPSVIGGLKQGWSFAWRRVMAGELITTLGGHPGIALTLSNAKDNADSVVVYEAMIVIFIIGVVVDAVFFGSAVRWVRKRYGLIDAADQ
jgi:NitT/TauT family transport system permease protein